MLLRYNGKEIKSLNELYDAFPQTSFPQEISDEDLETLGVEVIDRTGLPDGSAFSRAEKIKLFMDAIQERLDNFARSEGRFYDNMLSACTYAVSENPVYAAEGLYCVKMRDETWQTAYSILNDVMTGKRPEPSWEEFEAELPKLEWPKL